LKLRRLVRAERRDEPRLRLPRQGIARKQNEAVRRMVNGKTPLLNVRARICASDGFGMPKP
jgi:hypothetical protein